MTECLVIVDGYKSSDLVKNPTSTKLTIKNVDETGSDLLLTRFKSLKSAILDKKLDNEVLHIDLIAYSMGCTIAIAVMCWLIKSEPKIIVRKFIFIAPDLKYKRNYLDQQDFRRKKSGEKINTLIDQSKCLFKGVNLPNIRNFFDAFKFVTAKLDPSIFTVFYSKRDKIALFPGSTKRLINYYPGSNSFIDLIEYINVPAKYHHQNIYRVEMLQDKLIEMGLIITSAEGRKAYLAKIHYDTNPYPEKGWEHNEWWLGWSMAEENDRSSNFDWNTEKFT